MTTDSPDLRTRLAAVLPKHQSLIVHHLSTPPTKTDALYSPPPGERAERTFRENHFLGVSIEASDASTIEEKNGKRRVLVLGVEVFIYTSAHSTTIFVSKADSTGYLHLLKLPPGTPSPIREVTAKFISFLIDTRQRKNVPLVLSLFARSQSQYLFPGSVYNKGKHVLDDRGLVKWWCRVLDPLLSVKNKARGYITIPGLEDYDTRGYPPRDSKHWSVGIPLHRLSHYAKEYDWVPPRCLIPHFPDDPKSRFRDELDEEARGQGAFQTTGNWKSVKTLDTFWEMMAFRQECSSGRMTGFIWIVLDDEQDYKSLPTPTASFKEQSDPQTPKSQRTIVIRTPTTTPRKLFPRKDADAEPVKTPKKTKPKKKKLRGPITARQPRIKTSQKNYLIENTPAQTKYYTWPALGRGERIVSEKDYKRMLELLMHLDFATLDKAVGSTKRWISEVGLGKEWGVVVQGQREVEVKESQGKETTGVNNLNGLVKRKRTDSKPEAKTLDIGLVRKKPKAEGESVIVLGAGLIKKKPKTDETV